MEATEVKIELGSSYRDSVTGFSGVATSRLESLHSPAMVMLENDTGHRWVEILRVEEVGA